MTWSILECTFAQQLQNRIYNLHVHYAHNNVHVAQHVVQHHQVLNITVHVCRQVPLRSGVMVMSSLSHFCDAIPISNSSMSYSLTPSCMCMSNTCTSCRNMLFRFKHSCFVAVCRSRRGIEHLWVPVRLAGSQCPIAIGILWTCGATCVPEYTFIISHFWSVEHKFCRWM